MKGLHVDSIRKTYGAKLILSDIYLSCSRGEVIGLTGTNGSGKSTLLKIIFGVAKAETKYVRVDDKVIRTFKDSKTLIKYLPQENFLPNSVGVKKLIKLFLPKDQRKKLIQNESIKPSLQKEFQTLSGGEKRIVEILLLLHSEAEFLLLDEPFNGVSPLVRDLIMEYIKQSKKGFIITDHDYQNVLKIADRIYSLENGYLKEIKDKKELFEHGYLTKTAYNNI